MSSGSGTALKAGIFTIFGEGAGDVDADAARLRVEVVAPAARGAAPHADDVALAGDALADASGRARSAPTSTISPAYSWPMIIGTGMVFCAQSSQFQMWMSVPQMPVLRDLHQHLVRRRSRAPARSCSQRPGSGFGFDQGLHVVTHQLDDPELAAGIGEGLDRRSRCPPRVSAADICVRMRALPFGTTGKKKPAT